MDFILDSYVSSYLDVDWEIFVSMDLRFGDSGMLRFCSEQVFDKWNQFNHNKGMKFCVVSCFESLDLRCNMKVMSRGLGFDVVTEWYQSTRL